MRKVFYVLVGLILFCGAIGAFGLRQWDGPGYGHHHSGQRLLERSQDRQPYTVFDYWDGRRSADRRSWITASNVLDLLNAIVGIAGIVLTLNGMRLQRNGMQMSMRGRS